MAKTVIDCGCHHGYGVYSKSLTIYLLSFVAEGNQPPTLISEESTITVDEGTEVGTVVYRVNASDPEGSPITFGLKGTSNFTIDPKTGEIRVAKPLDREVSCPKAIHLY
ncbi:hypothetical protein J437_LFUL012379 [Ladona fulva]|uniref:Cadherin domain-containing protein n=1 Tax=Ladona fulva TaxID=123851 RepID=A0A8K0KF01_LADFU|nr:hypothetical protein J437_LFUL012379 [Ladona fulva]